MGKIKDQIYTSKCMVMPFDKDIHKKYLQHEKIENLKGLEVELIYEWEIGSMLIFDRSHLHCSSSVIDGKK